MEGRIVPVRSAHALQFTARTTGSYLTFASKMALSTTTSNWNVTPVSLAQNVWTIRSNGTDLLALTKNTLATFDSSPAFFSPDWLGVFGRCTTGPTGSWDESGAQMNLCYFRLDGTKVVLSQNFTNGTTSNPIGSGRRYLFNTPVGGCGKLL